MIRLATCDDDIRFLNEIDIQLQEYRKANESGIGITTDKYRSPQILLAAVLDGEPYDIFLLDVEMPEMDGVQLAAEIRRVLPQAAIIFLSAHTDFQLVQQSFQVNPMGYISKLAMGDSLFEALDSAILQLQSTCTRYLVSRHYKDIVRVPYDKIIYVQRVMRRLEIVIKGQREPLQDGRSLKELHCELNDPRFIYIGRSCFVNLDYVLRISDLRVHLKGDIILPVSKKLLPAVKENILNLWGSMK